MPEPTVPTASAPAPTFPVPLQVESPDPQPRRGEPVTCGVPWPRSLLPDVSRLRLQTSSGQAIGLQARTLDRWPDGSVRWALLDWLADVNSTASFDLVVAEGNES